MRKSSDPESLAVVETVTLAMPKHAAALGCGLWLHMGFVGATAVAAGLLELFNGEATWPSALTVAALGCVLAIGCWRRARMVLERAAPRAVIGTRAASRSSLRAHPHRTGRDAVGVLPSMSAAHEVEPR